MLNKGSIAFLIISVCTHWLANQCYLSATAEPSKAHSPETCPGVSQGSSLYVILVRPNMAVLVTVTVLTVLALTTGGKLKHSGTSVLGDLL